MWEKWRSWDGVWRFADCRVRSMSLRLSGREFQDVRPAKANTPPPYVARLTRGKSSSWGHVFVVSAYRLCQILQISEVFSGLLTLNSHLVAFFDITSSKVDRFSKFFYCRISIRGVATGGISVYIPSQNQSLKIILCTNCIRCRQAASI